MMSLDPLSSVLDFGKALIERFVPDPKAKADAIQKLAEMQQSGDLAVMAQQANINAVEAASPNAFIAGWRPGVGWVCGGGLAMAYVVGPFVQMVIALVAVAHGKPFVAPVVDMSTLSPILLAMLGMAGLRTYEKVNNAQGNH
jgi:hypothetical protein